LATAKLFVKEGAYVFITGRRPEGTRRGVKAIGSNVSAVQGDIAKLPDLDRLYETVSKVKGRIDIVFGNAGVAEFVPFGTVTEEHFDKLFNINVRGTLFTVQKALPPMNNGGSIILNGSVASFRGTAAFGVYAASKAAIRSFVRTWTTDLKDRHIRSNVVGLGPINTPQVSRQSADVIGRIAFIIPMGRMGEPEEVARRRCFWLRMPPVSSRVSNCSLTVAERRSNRVARPCAEEHRYGPSNHSDDGFAQSVGRITEGNSLPAPMNSPHFLGASSRSDLDAAFRD
jgi:NAD(P)-dependent dehydrogenase (short-subunit alcohol dehydrogenase family)